MKGRLFYLVPIATVVSIPVDSIQFITVQPTITADRVVFVVPGSTGRIIEGRVSDERP
jgi:hypothetical protein